MFGTKPKPDKSLHNIVCLIAILVVLNALATSFVLYKIHSFEESALIIYPTDIAEKIKNKVEQAEPKEEAKPKPENIWMQEGNLIRL
jgi:hypothetical protein